MIRRRLADGKATEKIDAVFTRLESLMDQWQRKKVRYSRKHQPDEKEPADLDFAALARANGLTSAQTPLISTIDASEYAIGKSLIEGRIPFATFAYQTLATLKPARSTDAKGRQYLFWIVNETPERIPAFGDRGVREEATEAWKMVQARKGALAVAKKLAEEACASGKIAEAVLRRPAGHPRCPAGAVHVDDLWEHRLLRLVCSAGDQRSRRRQPAGEGVHAGSVRPEEGRDRAALNQPQTVAYVIRAIDFSPPTRVLLTEFECSSPDTYAALAQSEMVETNQAWLKELRREAGLTWTPDRVKRSEGRAPPDRPARSLSTRRTTNPPFHPFLGVSA